MLSVVLTKLKSELSLINLGIDDLKEGQVLVKVIVSGLCGAQIQEINGFKGNANYLPHLLGHEGFGEVVEVGPKVNKVKIGQKVVMHWRKGSGLEADFPKYFSDIGVISSGKVTTLSEYSVVSENRITSVPDSTDPELGALLGCAFSTSFSFVNKYLSRLTVEKVLILGGGGLGLSILLALKKYSNLNITLLDFKNKSSNDKINFIDNIDKIKDIQFDIIVDTIGNQKLFTDAVSRLSPSGKMYLIAQPQPGSEYSIKNAEKLFEGEGKEVIAIQGGGFAPDFDLINILKDIESNFKDYKNIISHRFRLHEINQAIEVLKSGNAGRVVIWN